MQLQTKEDILSLLEAHAGPIRAMGVRRIGLFGSFVRGDQGPESDVDILVEFDPTQKTFDNFMHLSFFLEDMLARPVELVTPESISPHCRPRITETVEYAHFFD